jgi:hypothetical protein
VSVVRSFPCSTGSNVTYTSSILGQYKVSTTTTPPPTSGHVRYNNATQTSATSLYIHDETQDGIDIDLLLRRISIGTPLTVQDKDDHTNYQIYEVTGAPIDNGTYFEIPVTINSSGGTGTTNFANNHAVFVAAFGSGSVSDEAYGDSWNGVTGVAPSKNAVFDQIEKIKFDPVIYSYNGGF